MSLQRMIKWLSKELKIVNENENYNTKKNEQNSKKK